MQIIFSQDITKKIIHLSPHHLSNTGHVCLVKQKKDGICVPWKKNGTCVEYSWIILKIKILAPLLSGLGFMVYCLRLRDDFGPVLDYLKASLDWDKKKKNVRKLSMFLSYFVCLAWNKGWEKKYVFIIVENLFTNYFITKI